MLPNEQLSSVVLLGEYLVPDNKNPQPLRDYELGGIGLHDPSAGLQYQIWTCYYEAGDVKVSAPNTLPVVLFTDSNIVKLTFTFDQNMRPFVSYIKKDKTAWYWWFNTFTGLQTLTQLSGANSISSALDDKRKRENGTSDVVLIYTKSNNLYFRAQRDRYGVEYQLQAAINATVVKAGMTNKNRLQIKLIHN